MRETRPGDEAALESGLPSQVARVWPVVDGHSWTARGFTTRPGARLCSGAGGNARDLPLRLKAGSRYLPVMRGGEFVPAWAEATPDGLERGEEVLPLIGRLDALHGLFATSRWSMRALGAVVEPLVPPAFDH